MEWGPSGYRHRRHLRRRRDRRHTHLQRERLHLGPDRHLHRRRFSHGGHRHGQPHRRGRPAASRANDDTGRSQFDNVTYVNLPTIYIRLADGVLLNDLPGNGTTNSPPAGVITIPYSSSESTAGFRVAIFDGNNSQTPVGYATPVGSGFPGLYQYTFTTPLADGLHNITAAVQMIDPATPTETGFGGLSTLLAITVDTVPPPVFFGSSAEWVRRTRTGQRQRRAGLPGDQC